MGTFKLALVRWALLELSHPRGCPLLCFWKGGAPLGKGREAAGRDAQFSWGPAWREPPSMSGSEHSACPFQRSHPLAWEAC